ncbi:hypothetical protein ES708_17851 [subsurface metagenome]
MQRGKQEREFNRVFFIRKQRAVAVLIPVVRKGNEHETLQPFFVFRNRAGANPRGGEGLASESLTPALVGGEKK